MNEDVIKKIINCLSIARVSAYTNIGFKTESKELIDAYFSLQEMSSHFFVPIQVLEICLRNSIQTALYRRFPKDEKTGKNWYDLLPISDESKKIVISAKAKSLVNAGKKGAKNYTEDDLVSNMMFGFWVHMLEPIHATLQSNPYHFWQYELDNIFPGRSGKSVKEIFSELKRINVYRNRLYHHEPVWKGKKVKSLNQAIASLEREYDNVLSVIKWLSPEKINYMVDVGFKARFEECCNKYRQ